ncbi:MAG: hypothetical protein KGQ66_15745 [Acidobacteriota bacterium]|nr:hypothetical protein [Acidobacteriota bacterium]
MSTWNNSQNLETLGFKDAGSDGWVRAEEPCTVVQAKAPFEVTSTVRPDSNGLWNRVRVTVTHPDSQGNSLWFAFNLSAEQTDSGGYPDADRLVADYMDDEEDDETRQMGGAQTFSELREYAAQVAQRIVHG